MKSPFDLEITDVDHLPIIRKFANRLGIVETINKMVSGRMEADIGETVLFLLLDILSGRSPLYRVSQRYSPLEVEGLMGKNFDPSNLEVHTLRRILDKLHDVGTQKVLTEISHRAIREFDLDTRAVHFDTTSISVEGSQYPEPPPESDVPHITHGYSKDHRPDLRQFLVSLLCVNRNIPILGRVENGNTSDVTQNNKVLTDVSRYLADHGIDPKGTIYVADSALVSGSNLEVAQGMKFLTRLPTRYNECKRVITEAVSRNTWSPIGRLSQHPGSCKRPAAVYACQEATVSLYETDYRAVVVHSSAHDKRRQGAVDRKLKQDRKELLGQCKAVTSISFHCEADAIDAGKRLTGESSALHAIQTRIEAVPHYGKGRPPKHGERKPLRIDYRVVADIVEKQEEIAVLRKEAGCIVLLTNLDSKEDRHAFDGKALLSLYKEQYGIEQNFGFLKDPTIVDGIFLKRPERIEVLGLLLILALMIWRLMEREMRLHVKRTGEPLTGWPTHPKTMKPTAFMMTTKFHSIRLVRFEGLLQLAQPFNEVQSEYLRALGVEAIDFLPPL